MIPNLTEILPTTASPNTEKSVEAGSRQGDRNEWRSAFEKAAAAGDLRKPDKPGKTGPAGPEKRTPVSESGSEEKVEPEGKEPAEQQLSLDTQPLEEPVSEETPNPIEIAPEALPTPTLDPPVAAAPLPEVESEVEAEVVPVPEIEPAPEIETPGPNLVSPPPAEPQIETKPVAEDSPAPVQSTDTEKKTASEPAPDMKRAVPVPNGSPDPVPAEPVETAPSKPVENPSPAPAPAPAPEIKPVEGKVVEAQPAERAPAPPVSTQETATPVKIDAPSSRPAATETTVQEIPAAREQVPVNTELPVEAPAGNEQGDLTATAQPSQAAGVITPEQPVEPVQPEPPVTPVQPDRPAVRRPDGNRGNHGRTARTGPPEHARKQGPKTGNRPEVPPGQLRAMQQKASDALHRVSTALNTKHPAAPLQEPVAADLPKSDPAPAPVELRDPVFPELPQDRAVPIEALRGVRDLPIRKFVAGPKPAQAPLTEFQTLHATSRTAQSAAAGAKQPAIPIHYASLAEAIVARTQALSRNGTTRLRFALEPNDLGLVKVKIDSRGQAVRVEIAASTSQAVDTLNQGANRLSQQLQDAGFKDAQVQLTLDTSTDSGAQAKHSQHAQQQAEAGRRGSSYHRSRETARAARQYPVIPTSGRLDFVA
jgi:hypothetical protein